MIGFKYLMMAGTTRFWNFIKKCLLVSIFVCLLKWASLSIAQADLELSDSSETSASGSTVESISGIYKQSWLHFCLQVVFYKPYIFISCFLVILALNGNCCFRLRTSLRQGYNPGFRKVTKGISLTNGIGLVTEEATIRDTTEDLSYNLQLTSLSFS